MWPLKSPRWQHHSLARRTTGQFKTKTLILSSQVLVLLSQGAATLQGANRHKVIINVVILQGMNRHKVIISILQGVNRHSLHFYPIRGEQAGIVAGNAHILHRMHYTASQQWTSDITAYKQENPMCCSLRKVKEILSSSDN